MAETFLFRVDKIFPLPGLGLLLLPAPGASALDSQALHAALRLTLRHPTGPAEPAVATVEEITRDAAPAVRGLLLPEPGPRPVAPGTEVWWAGAVMGWEELL